MLVRAPLVQAEQDGSIRIEDLAEVVVRRSRRGWPKSAWYHVKLPGRSRTPMIVHVRFMSR
jgi:hypothetical protein